MAAVDLQMIAGLHMCERWIVPRAGTALVAVPDTMRIYRTEVYLLSFVTAPFDANHREARGLSLEERHRHLEHLEDVNEHAQKNYCGRRSEERRVGKEGVSTCRYRWSPSY